MAIVTRIRGRELQRRRERLFAKFPWCVKCLLRDVKTHATIRNHIVPLTEGGTEDESNEEAVCLDCFDDAKALQAQRGVRPSGLTKGFRKSATPRGDHAGQFSVRRRPL